MPCITSTHICVTHRAMDLLPVRSHKELKEGRKFIMVQVYCHNCYVLFLLKFCFVVILESHNGPS